MLNYVFRYERLISGILCLTLNWIDWKLPIIECQMKYEQQWSLINRTVCKNVNGSQYLSLGMHLTLYSIEQNLIWTLTLCVGKCKITVIVVTEVWRKKKKRIKRYVKSGPMKYPVKMCQFSNNWYIVQNFNEIFFSESRSSKHWNWWNDFELL